MMKSLILRVAEYWKATFPMSSSYFTHYEFFKAAALRSLWCIFCAFLVYQGILPPAASSTLMLLAFLWGILAPLTYFIRCFWFIIFIDQPPYLACHSEEDPADLETYWWLPRIIDVFGLSPSRLHNFLSPNIEFANVLARKSYPYPFPGLFYVLRAQEQFRRAYLICFWMSVPIVFLNSWVIKITAITAVILCICVLFSRKGRGVFGTLEAVYHDNLPGLYRKLAARKTGGWYSFPTNILVKHTHLGVHCDFYNLENITSLLFLRLVNKRIIKLPPEFTAPHAPTYVYYLRIRKNRLRFFYGNPNRIYHAGNFKLLDLSEVLNLRSRDTFLACGGGLFRYIPLYYNIVIRTNIILRRNIYFLFTFGGISVSTTLLFTGHWLPGTLILFICMYFFLKLYRARLLPPESYKDYILHLYREFLGLTTLRGGRVGTVVPRPFIFLEKFRLSPAINFEKKRYLRHKLRRIIRHSLHAVQHNFILRRNKPVFSLGYWKLYTLSIPDLVSECGVDNSVRFFSLLHGLRRYLLRLRADIFRLFIIIIITIFLCSIFTVAFVFYFWHF